MPTIKNFSTKKDIPQQFVDNGVEIKLRICFNGVTKLGKNPFKDVVVKDGEMKQIDIAKMVDVAILEEWLQKTDEEIIP
ncbi:MAG TPA: hypothetical protein VJL60_02985 [Gammaproteobacteria bacterium]|nr:hypothetical protein [Gammaproteobacteria bacterium]